MRTETVTETSETRSGRKTMAGIGMTTKGSSGRAKASSPGAPRGHTRKNKTTSTNVPEEEAKRMEFTHENALLTSILNQEKYANELLGTLGQAKGPLDKLVKKVVLEHAGATRGPWRGQHSRGPYLRTQNGRPAICCPDQREGCLITSVFHVFGRMKWKPAPSPRHNFVRSANFASGKRWPR